MNPVSDRILAIITAKDISYGELSKLTGIPKSALQRYATGQTAKIPIDRVETIAKALNVDSAVLLGWATPDIGEEALKNLRDIQRKEYEKDDMAEYIEEVRHRPEIRQLLEVSRGVSRENIEAVVKMIQGFSNN